MPRKRNLTTAELVVWFWSNVDCSGGPEACWPWMAGRNSGGYGQVQWAGQTQSTHRVAYEITFGPIPPGEGYHGTCVLHHCDNGHLACVNPAHLFLGTQTENTAERDEKGRHVALLGESHGCAILNDDKVRDIRAAYASGESQQSIGNRVGVGRTTIRRIVRRETWKHVVQSQSESHA